MIRYRGAQGRDEVRLRSAITTLGLARDKWSALAYGVDRSSSPALQSLAASMKAALDDVLQRALDDPKLIA